MSAEHQRRSLEAHAPLGRGHHYAPAVRSIRQRTSKFVSRLGILDTPMQPQQRLAGCQHLSCRQQTQPRQLIAHLDVLISKLRHPLSISWRTRASYVRMTPARSEEGDKRIGQCLARPAVLLTSPLYDGGDHKGRQARSCCSPCGPSTGIHRAAIVVNIDHSGTANRQSCPAGPWHHQYLAEHGPQDWRRRCRLAVPPTERSHLHRRSDQP